MIKVLWLLTVVGSGTSTPATASRATCSFSLHAAFYLPVEVGTGTHIGAGSPVPWSFSARANPTVALGRSGKLTLSGVGGRGFINPGWEWLYGGRVGFRPIQAPFGLLGVEVAVEAVWGSEGRNPGSLALTIDIGETLTLTARAGPDLGNGRGFFEVGFGLHSVWSPPSRTLELPEMGGKPRFDELAAQGALTRLAALVVDDTDDPLMVDCVMVDNIERVLDLERGDPSLSLAAFGTRLREGSLAGLAEEIPGEEGIISLAKLAHRISHNEPDYDPTDLESIRALNEGMRRIVQAVHKSGMPALQPET